MNLEELWNDHSGDAFPARCRGVEIDGIDLSLLDTYAAGCIGTFLGREGLDADTRVILQRCAEQLEQVMPRLDAADRPYFQRLHTLAERVLRESRFN